MLEDYAAKNSITNIVHFTDDGISGTRFDRPGFVAMMDEVDAGKVSAIIVKDMSRLGRDYLRVGLCMETLREQGVRLIALNDGVDTAQGDDDFTPFRNIMAEWYARDTSRKIKSAAKAKGSKGKRLSNVPIYGYKCDPNDRTQWIIDEEAAEVVRRIYQLTIEGKGPQVISKILAADKVERVSHHMTAMGIVNYTRSVSEETKYDWNNKNISDIIAKQEYMGHTVNFRTSRDSYKSKRVTFNPQDEWMIFENTHPAIVDEETWNLAQRCRTTKRRTNHEGEANPLTGLVYCADCGERMYNHREPKTDKMYYHAKVGKYYPRSPRDIYSCSTNVRSQKRLERTCTMHYIRSAALRELILDTIQNISRYVRKSEAEFINQVREASEIRQKETAKARKKQLAKSEKRHAHIMLTMRPFEPDGSWAAKSRKEYILDDNGDKILLKSGEYKSRKVDSTDWNDQSKAEVWRQGWADICNEYLTKNDVTERIDHRSYERQGVAQIPTIHMGVAATQMERRGIVTERGNINRDIVVTNNQLRQLRARITKLQDWLKEESENATPPTLADVISNILTRREQQSNYQTIINLQSASKMLNFLTANKIMDMAGLEDKVKSMFGKQDDIRVKLKAAERRLDTLDEHIKQADIYLAHKTVYKHYQQEKNPKWKEKYADAHHAEITLYGAASRYLKGVMNGHTSLPIKSWKAERDTLITERKRLNQEYVMLKEEVREVEVIRRNVYDIMRAEARREQPKRTQDVEL
jgi:DNA invertase Pin-like site-specific DNA recombinase